MTSSAYVSETFLPAYPGGAPQRNGSLLIAREKRQYG